MRSYVPPVGWQESEDEDAPRKRAKKDKQAPKRPRTAYILFSMDFRYYWSISTHTAQRFGVCNDHCLPAVGLARIKTSHQPGLAKPHH